jgi:hypothetical protein
MSAHDATLHRVGDITPPFYLHREAGGAAAKLYVTLTVNGGTVVLEHLANEAVSTEAGTWSTDATYNTNQTRTQRTGTVDFMYRLRCSIAPSAGKGITALLEAAA